MGEIDLPVVGHDQCEASLRTTRLGKRFQLDDSFICAGGADGKDTCKGDGGSPLVCQSKFDPTSYVQAGIVAWGIGCGEDNTPGVYASVSKGVCWIDYAMTCQFGQQSGSYSSYWGYSAQQCQTWMNGGLSRLNEAAPMLTLLHPLLTPQMATQSQRQWTPLHSPTARILNQRLHLKLTPGRTQMTQQISLER